VNFFENKVVWITGASSGIGEALVRQFAKENAKIILSSRNEKELQRVADSAKLNQTNCLILPFDLADTGNISSHTNKVVEKFGRIDILVNNGGISQRAYTKDTSLEIDRKIMEVNYFGQIALTKSVLPFMLKQKSGQIVVISSISGKIGFFLRSAYSASKHALHGFFDSLRMEILNDNVKVLLVCPGKINTKISINALTAEGTQHGKLDESTANGMSAEDCAKRILKAIKNNEEEIYVGQQKQRTALWLKRFFPKLFSNLIRKQKPE